MVVKAKANNVQYSQVGFSDSCDKTSDARRPARFRRDRSLFLRGPNLHLCGVILVPRMGKTISFIRAQYILASCIL